MFWEGINDTLVKYAKKDFEISIPKDSEFIVIKNNVIKELKKLSHKDLINLKSELQLIITSLQLHNIDAFMSIRFAFYTIVITIVVIIKGINLEHYIRYIVWGLIFVLISFRYTSDTQKDRMLYYKFKLDCINELLT